MVGMASAQRHGVIPANFYQKASELPLVCLSVLQLPGQLLSVNKKAGCYGYVKLSACGDRGRSSGQNIGVARFERFLHCYGANALNHGASLWRR